MEPLDVVIVTVAAGKRRCLPNAKHNCYGYSMEGERSDIGEKSCPQTQRDRLEL